MTDVKSVFATALHEICGVDLAEITDEKHIFDDLGVDSLDFLDVTFELDNKLGVKLPVEEWLSAEDAGEGDGRSVLVVGQFVSFVEAEVLSRGGK